jgi:hypothetical protein
MSVDSHGGSLTLVHALSLLDPLLEVAGSSLDRLDMRRASIVRVLKWIVFLVDIMIRAGVLASLLLVIITLGVLLFIVIYCIFMAFI